MHVKETLGRLGRHIPRHGSTKEVLIMEAPQARGSESWRYTQARWSSTDFDDPWPTRG